MRAYPVIAVLFVLTLMLPLAAWAWGNAKCQRNDVQRETAAEPADIAGRTDSVLGTGVTAGVVCNPAAPEVLVTGKVK